jgi:hypothetical protein
MLAAGSKPARRPSFLNPFRVSRFSYTKTVPFSTDNTRASPDHGTHCDLLSGQHIIHRAVV